MKKIIIFLIGISSLQAQIKDETIYIDFDITINGSKNDTSEYSFQMYSPSVNISHKSIVNTTNLMFYAWPNEEYVFIFKQKNSNIVVVKLNTDTIKNKKITIPVNLYEQTIRKRVQKRNN